MASIRNEFYRLEWQRRNAKAAALVQQGFCTVSVVKTAGNRVHVSAPFRSEFMAHAQQLRGSWRPKTKVWTFTPDLLEDVLALCKRIYGHQKVRVRGVRSE